MALNQYSEEYDQREIALLDQLLMGQQQAVLQHPVSTAAQRITDLKALKQALIANERQLIDAMNSDFGNRAAGDARLGDILTTVMSANYAIRRVKGWMKPSKRHVGLLFQPAKAEVIYQPLGVVGIITPWNYPVFLSLGPLITALSAGNRAIIKMSEYTPATNEVIKTIIGKTFPPEQVAVVDGGAVVAAHFTGLDFDHLLFTGSTEVGKKVMASASAQLTPVTLELGGKSPVIIDEQMDMAVAVDRFILAKTVNAGQTCVAPDYILCPKDNIPALISAIRSRFTQLYPGVADNPDYTSIINPDQLQRLLALLDDAQEKGATLISLAETPEAIKQQKLPLTLVTGLTDKMLLSQEEIFGPILPIVAYGEIGEAIRYVNNRPKPLALYVMSFQQSFQQQVLEQTRSGGVCINDAAMHVAQDDLPFGGIGASGMGQYHGHEGFLTLSKAKAVFRRGRWSTGQFIFPPYHNLIHKIIYRLFIR